MDNQPITAPWKKDGLKGEVRFIAEQLKQQGKPVTIAMVKARKENENFATVCGLSLLEEELRAEVHGVYGTGTDWRGAFHTQTEALTLPENVQIVIRGLCNVGNICIWGGLRSTARATCSCPSSRHFFRARSGLTILRCRRASVFSILCLKLVCVVW